MLTSPDFRELSQLLDEHEVRYLIVDDYAVMRYAERRFTKDLVVLIAVDPVNAAAVFAALRAFGAPLVGSTLDDFAAEGSFYQMGNPPMRVGMLKDVPGVDFAEAWPRRETVMIGDAPTHFIGEDHLIASKRAGGRPKDLLDLEWLEVGLCALHRTTSNAFGAADRRHPAQASLNPLPSPAAGSPRARPRCPSARS